MKYIIVGLGSFGASLAENLPLKATKLLALILK